MSPSISSSAARAPSTMPWSSASTTRIVLRPTSLAGGFNLFRLLVHGDGFVRSAIVCGPFLEWKHNGQRGSGFVAAVKSAAQHLDALAHASQTIALHADETLAIVGNF